MRLIDADKIEYDFNIKTYADNRTIVTSLLADKDTIDAMPTIEPNRWIPCSERLPEHSENDDYYLVTIQCEHYDGWDDYVTAVAEWTKHGWDELSCYIGQRKVVAWMPLPEPARLEDD